jgi:DNA (cytosine-5)-methyltransferase 1
MLKKHSEPTTMIQALDFFCGAGGMTRGLLDAGIKVVAGFDSDERCGETYERNNSDVKFVSKDIRSLTIKDLMQFACSDSFEEMLFAGCAPCQPFSQQKKGDRRVRDATLLGEFGRIVELAKPGYVLIENVPGIAKVKGFSTFLRFLETLSRNGYKYVFDVINAKHYGVPQNRRRLVMIASRFFLPSLPKPKYGPTIRPYRTVRQAIDHFPELETGKYCSEIPNHVAALLTPLNIERLIHTPHSGGDRRSWPSYLRLNCHSGNYNGHTDVYGRMAWDTPAPTLTGRCNSISNGRYGHPTQNRAISLREAASIQTFPDGYVFYGSNKHIALQIGNAVPVRLAEELGKHILKLWKSRKEAELGDRNSRNTRLQRASKKIINKKTIIHEIALKYFAEQNFTL